MRAPLRWLLWDVKDTLLKVRVPVGEQYSQEAERLGLTLSPIEVNAAFLKVYRRYSSKYPNYGLPGGVDGQAWWVGVVKDTLYQCRVTDPHLLDTIANNLYFNYCNAENWEVFPDSKPALENCASLGLKLGIVSNFDNRLETILRNCGLLSYFSFLVTSEQAGAAKPKPIIFDLGLKECRASADTVAYIGDHYVNDYLASRSVGIHGFLLDRYGSYETYVPPEHRLTSLEELPPRLQKYMEQQ